MIFLDHIDNHADRRCRLSSLLEINAVTKKYLVKKNVENSEVALRGVSLLVNKGDFVVINGPSGSGKSTLLHIISGIDSPTSGSVLFEGNDLSAMSDDEATELRRNGIVLIFQSFELIQSITVYENIEYPLRLMGVSSKERKILVNNIMTELNIESFHSRFPRELSGGQQQRVGICRALVVSPRLLVGDEITANLDSENGYLVYEILKRRQEEYGMTIITVSHDPRLNVYSNRVINLCDGLII